LEEAGQPAMGQIGYSSSGDRRKQGPGRRHRNYQLDRQSQSECCGPAAALTPPERDPGERTVAQALAPIPLLAGDAIVATDGWARVS
jgi:hypothetical protein